MNKQKQIEEMAGDMDYGCVKRDLYPDDAKEIAKALYLLGYRKIPENAVVLTDEELNKELDAIKCVMIVHDDDGERYVSYDDYKEFTDRLGKIARQRKVRIEQLEKLLDDRCDSCIERVRKETAKEILQIAIPLSDMCESFYEFQNRFIDLIEVIYGIEVETKTIIRDKNGTK